MSVVGYKCGSCGARLSANTVSHYCEVATRASMRERRVHGGKSAVEICDGCGRYGDRADMYTFNPDGTRRFVCGACATAGYIEACQS